MAKHFGRDSGDQKTAHPYIRWTYRLHVVRAPRKRADRNWRSYWNRQRSERRSDSRRSHHGLDFSALTLYTPGAVSTYGNTATNVIERDTYCSDSVNVNGNRAQANNYTLEGLEMNETFNNEIGYSPPPAAPDESRLSRRTHRPSWAT